MRPSHHSRAFPHTPSATRRTLASSSTGISSTSEDLRTGSLQMSAETPRMSSMFAMLLPTTFPIERSAEPVAAEVAETASSGMDVPNATTVSPMTSGDTRHFSATPAAPSTKKSAPLTRSTSPTMMRNIQRYSTEERLLFRKRGLYSKAYHVFRKKSSARPVCGRGARIFIPFFRVL